MKRAAWLLIVPLVLACFMGSPPAGFVGSWYWTAGRITTTCDGTPSDRSAAGELVRIDASPGAGGSSVDAQAPGESCADTFTVDGDEAVIESSTGCGIQPATWTVNRMRLSSDERTITWELSGSFQSNLGGTCQKAGTLTLTRSPGSGGGGGSDAGSNGTLRATFSNLSGSPQTTGEPFEATNVYCTCINNCSTFRVDADNPTNASAGRTVIVRTNNGPPAAGQTFLMGTNSSVHPATAEFIDRRSGTSHDWDTRSLFLDGGRGTLVFDSFGNGSASFRVNAAVLSRASSPTTGTFQMDVVGTCNRISQQ